MLLKEIGEGKPDERRPSGRPRKRWWICTRVDINQVVAAIEEAPD